MAKTWTIQRITGFDSQAKPIIENVITIHELEYHGEWMGKCFVTVNIKSPEPIDWHFDDFLEYRGEIFSISYDPNVVKKARRGTYAEGFTYDNIKFYAIGDKIRFFGFKDVVLNQNSAANTQVYTSLATFSFFCSSVEDFADRLQANLDREQQSELLDGKPFKVLTPSALRTSQRLGSLPAEWNTYFDSHDESQTVYIEGETDVNIDIDKQNCYDVLKYSYDKFGLSYFIKGTTIIIGGKPIHLNTGSQNIFRYGKGLGLYEVERTSDEDIEIVTKLFAYGSDKNLPLNYYANLGKQMITPGQRDMIYSIYGLKTQLPYDTCVKATNQGLGVTLKYGNLTVRAHCNSYVESEQKKVWWYFPNDQGGADEAFYNALGEGIHADIYVVGGADISLWPAAAIVTPTEYDYPAALSINKLMLPGFPDMSLDEWVQAKVDAEQDEHGEWHTLYARYHFSTDRKDPWIESKNADAIGIFEGVVNFDGSQAKEIYPTIENTDAGVVTRGSQITDNGFVIDSKTFLIEVSDDVLDWKDAMEKAQEEVSISMTSGFCTGRDFKVDKAERNATDDGWVLTLERHLDNSLNRYFPYHDSYVSGYCQIRVGDTFVVTGIQMPDEYIEAAAEKMLIAACGYLDKRDHMRYTYLPKIDELFMQRDHDNRGNVSYYSIICAGMKLEFEDTDLGIWQAPYIDQLTIKENGNNGIPTYDVVLRDEKEKSKFEKMAERIEELTGATQIVERQSYPSMNIDYSEWVAGTPYYYQTLNTNPNPDISDRPYVETSYVWHRYKKWMCLRTLTQEEPKLGCKDWKVVEGNTNFIGEMLTSNGNTFRNGDVDTVLTMKVWWGDEDVTEQIKAMSHQFSWSRSTGYDSVQSQFVQQSEDLTWEPDFVSEDKVHLVRGDMGSGWMITYRKALIACLVTFSLAQGEQTDVLGSYKF